MAEETVTFEIVVYHFSKFWSLWEAGKLLEGRLIKHSDSDDPWERTHFLIFEIDSDQADRFELGLWREHCDFSLTRKQTKTNELVGAEGN